MRTKSLAIIGAFLIILLVISIIFRIAYLKEITGLLAVIWAFYFAKSQKETQKEKEAYTKQFSYFYFIMLIIAFGSMFLILFLRETFRLNPKILYVWFFGILIISIVLAKKIFEPKQKP